MPNRIIHGLNDVAASAEAIQSFYTKQYLRQEKYIPSDYLWKQLPESIGINKYYRVCGYALNSTRENDYSNITSLAAQIVTALSKVRTAMAYTLYYETGSLNVYCGTNYRHSQIIADALTGDSLNASLENIWIHPEKLTKVQQHNAILVGTTKPECGAIDRLISSLCIDGNYIINFLCIPCSDDEVIDARKQLYRLHELLEPVSTYEWTYGAGRQRRHTTTNADVADAIRAIDAAQECLERNAWKVLIHIGASTVSDMQQVTASLAAMLGSAIPFPCNRAIILRSAWRYPAVFLGDINFGGLYSHSLMNVVDDETLRSLIALPMQSHGESYQVLHIGEAARGERIWNTTPPRVTQQDRACFLGVLENKREYSYALDDLRQHAFVTGATRSGKTTSVQKILYDAHRHGIPFIVLEAAKKEYWELKNAIGMEKARVYSAGADALPLRVNPFVPELGTRLSFHIQSLVDVFLSAFDNDDPIPEILTLLIYKCYEVHGWNPEQYIDGSEELTYPTLGDMLTNVNDVVRHIGYDAEIERRMAAVIRARIEPLVLNYGSVLNTNETLSVEDLFQTSAVIELDDFSEKERPFIASLMALKIREHAQQCSQSPRLERLVIVEEAHTIMPNPELPSASRNAARCAGYFSNMLAEISAYGTGIVVVEQRPALIAPGAIANTGIKVIHTLQQGADIDTVLQGLALAQNANTIISRLRIGQAAVSFPQAKQICIVNVRKNDATNNRAHLGCIFCNDPMHCASHYQIPPYAMNTIRTRGVSASVLRDCVTAIASYNGLDGGELSVEEKMCIAGRLCKELFGGEKNPLQLRRTLYGLYRTYANR